MIVPIELRLRARALGLSIHTYARGGWVLARRAGSEYRAFGKGGASLQEIAAELAEREMQSQPA
jgi:hypothetical protein